MKAIHLKTRDRVFTLCGLLVASKRGIDEVSFENLGAVTCKTCRSLADSIAEPETDSRLQRGVR